MLCRIVKDQRDGRLPPGSLIKAFSCREDLALAPIAPHGARTKPEPQAAGRAPSLARRANLNHKYTIRWIIHIDLAWRPTADRVGAGFSAPTRRWLGGYNNSQKTNDRGGVFAVAA